MSRDLLFELTLLGVLTVLVVLLLGVTVAGEPAPAVTTPPHTVVPISEPGE